MVEKTSSSILCMNSVLCTHVSKLCQTLSILIWQIVHLSYARIVLRICGGDLIFFDFFYLLCFKMIDSNCSSPKWIKHEYVYEIFFKVFLVKCLVPKALNKFHLVSMHKRFQASSVFFILIWQIFHLSYARIILP